MQDVTIQPSVRQRTVHVKKKKELDVDTHTYFTERLAPNFYIEQREGQVLSRGMLLKYDRFPSSKIIRSKSGVSISGGPNYRKIDDELPLCAVGQPSIHGIRTILNLLIGSPLRKQLTNNSDNILEDDIILMSPDATDSNTDSNNTGSCIWFNLREEPVVYLNNRPFVLRDSDHPFRNIQTFKGITYQHLGEVEQRLKRDILIEASKHNNILIHKENSNKLILPCWEGITYGSIKTSSEAFLSLFNEEEGYNVKYYRIPLTPESDLLNSTIDSIFKIVIKHTINNKLIPYFIMNCQMGRGRSTLVTILVWLIFNKLELITIKKKAPSPKPKPNVFNAFSPPPPRKLFRIPSTPTVNITRSQSNPNFQSFRPKRKSLKLMKEFSFKEEDEYSAEEHGHYEIIHRILRLLSNGMKAKENVDLAIERCGHLYDLKQEMAKCRLKLENAENDDEKELATLESQIILSKYCTLISFAAYLQSVNLDNICDLEVSTQFDFISNSFSSWLNERPSLQKIRKDITVLSYTDLMDKYRSKTPKTNLNAMLIFNRIGSVLGANSILKSDIIINKKKELFSDIHRINENETLRLIKFRFLSDVGIATCSQPPSNSIKSILNKIKLNDSEYKDENNNAIWIDLREEPILYIHNKPYVVRNYNRPFQRLPEFDNLLSAKQINDITERLKNDIINELMDNNNKILTHYESESHELLENILSINVDNKSEIETLQQIFYRLSNEEGYNVQYKKLPFNPQNSLQPLQLERLGEIITKHIQTNNIIIFNCRQGIHRSSVAAVLSVLIAYHIGTLTYINDINDSDNNINNNTPQTPENKRFKSRPNMPLLTPRVSPTNISRSEEDMEPLILECDISYMDNNDNNNNDDDSDNEIYSDDDIECFGVLSLIRILRHGLIMKRQVDNAVESFSEYYHVKNEIYSARAKWQASRTKEESDAYLQQAMRHLRIYTNLICYNAYLYEYYYAKKYNDTIKYKYKLLTFTQWIQSRLELKLWLKKMIQNPQLSLSMQNINMDDEEKDDNDNNKQSFTKVFHERVKKSSVLTGNAMLKVDYFPGCAQLIANNNVQNAINFRYIDNIGLSGVAIPTTKAIKEIVLFCAKKWILKNGNDTVPIHWICLREEPVLYVNDEPVVLRCYNQPYENLIFTGITKKRVEAMEKALKEDAKKECLKFDNKLLIHSESDTGNLEAKWEEIENQKIMTCKEAFSNAFDNCPIDINLKINPIYNRLPITDEQAPPPIIIDIFINIFEINSLKSIFIFNCQMGRGRTTTAMCIYALWKRKLNLYKLIEKQKQKEEEKKNHINEEKKNKIKSYINGEFYAVLDLLRILPQGKKAKKWCDDVIDVLSHMQNLRKAIYKMKLRMDKAVNQKSKKHLKQKVKNYLQRYCLLIALTSYLLNDYKPPINDNDNDNKENNKNKRVTFQEWLEERAAVKNCIYSASLEKD